LDVSPLETFYDLTFYDLTFYDLLTINKSGGILLLRLNRSYRDQR
jgi:hypothetical protein